MVQLGLTAESYISYWVTSLARIQTRAAKTGSPNPDALTHHATHPIA